MPSRSKRRFRLVFVSHFRKGLTYVDFDFGCGSVLCGGSSRRRRRRRREGDERDHDRSDGDPDSNRFGPHAVIGDRSLGFASLRAEAADLSSSIRRDLNGNPLDDISRDLFLSPIVESGRAGIGVAEQILHVFQRHALLQQIGRRATAKRMG